MPARLGAVLVRAVKGLVAAFWLVAMIAWFPAARIETAALSHPDHATVEYTEPLHIKGVVRYVSAYDKRIDHLCSIAFIGGLAVSVCLFAALVALRTLPRTN